MSKLPKLFWIGSPLFSSALADCGWQVACHNFEHTAVFSFNEIIELAGWEPDVLVVADKSRPPFVLGMENFPCLTVFYCIDSHIHSWYPFYAQGFDLCLISLRDHIPMFTGRELPPDRLIWSPAFAKDSDTPLDENLADESGRDTDCLFVGSVNKETLPKRAAFLQELELEFSGLRILQGDYRRLFARARILLNHCEAGDLNFRVFEALGCGGCLLTPRIGHGLEDIFHPGRELELYNPNDAADAARKLTALLADPAKRASMRRSGLAAVNAGHRAAHRAQNFTRQVKELLPAKDIIAARRIKASAIRGNWLKRPYLLLAEAHDIPLLKEAYLAAARGEF